MPAQASAKTLEAELCECEAGEESVCGTMRNEAGRKRSYVELMTTGDAVESVPAGVSGGAGALVIP